MFRRFLVIAVIFVAPLPVFAATLSFSPSAKTVVVGQAFSMDVVVSSPDQAMNAASGDLSFPADKLQVLSVTKTNSILNLWIRDPSFSNTGQQGDVNFEGVALNPGWIGNDGTVITINFQAIAPGAAPIIFSDSSVLANDGNGTEILTEASPANITVITAPPPSPSAPVVPATTSVLQIATPTASSEPATMQVASSSLPASSTPVVVNGWFGEAIPSLFQWILLALLIFILVAAIIFLIIYGIRHRRKDSSHEITRKRKELRDDLMRIEKEFEADQEASKIDLSPSGVRKRQTRIKHEIEHLEEDLKDDL